jgi:hypothetical protein
MFVFKATPDGGLDAGSDYNKARFKEWLKKHAGLRVRIELDEPESNKLRRYFEGAVVPEVCQHWEWCDPSKPDDLVACRELLKAEFNGRWLPTPSGGMRKVALSTKTQKVLRPFVNRVTDWMAEQGMPVPNPELYKKFRDSAMLADGGGYHEWLRKKGTKSDGTPL